MAQIDVSEQLLDPDFLDPLTLINRTSSIDIYGANVIVEASTATHGSSQPTSGKELMRLPEALRDQNLQTFFIFAPVIVDGSGTYPSIIVFQGQRYQVKIATPWLNWGRGWNQAICVREQPAP